MANPYIDTIIEVDISILPHQMDNNIMDHLKENITKRYLRKCYLNYGYISNIYKIEEPIRGGIIRSDDMTCSALYNVRFSCKLCNPLINTNYVAKVTGRNQMLIIGENGPIRFIISKDYINKDRIAYIQTKSAFFPKNTNGEIVNTPIEKGTYIIVKVMSKKIVNNGARIETFATLDAVASDEEIKQNIKYEFDQQDITDIREFTKTSEQQEQTRTELTEDIEGAEGGGKDGDDEEEDNEEESEEDNDESDEDDGQ